MSKTLKIWFINPENYHAIRKDKKISRKIKSKKLYLLTYNLFLWEKEIDQKIETKNVKNDRHTVKHCLK